MSWKNGSELFNDVFPIVTTAFPDANERTIYLCNLIDALMENGMAYQDLVPSTPEIATVLENIEHRKNIIKKYWSSYEQKLSGEHNREIVFSLLRKAKLTSQSHELKHSRAQARSKQEAFQKILATSDEHIDDDEVLMSFIQDLLTAFHISQNELVWLSQNDRKFGQWLFKIQVKFTHDEVQLEKLEKRDHNLASLKKEIKLFETKLNSVLRTQEKQTENVTVIYDVAQDNKAVNTTAQKTKKKSSKHTEPFTLTADTPKSLVTAISEKTNISTADVEKVLDTLTTLADEELRNSGKLTLLNMVQVNATVKPATEESEGVNPFTGEKMTIKPKPEQVRVKAIPTTQLKAFVDTLLT